MFLGNSGHKHETDTDRQRERQPENTIYLVTPAAGMEAQELKRDIQNIENEMAKGDIIISGTPMGTFESDH